jgi:AAHS family 4-hydroxybenzoate transporter-like MFS transporter
LTIPGTAVDAGRLIDDGRWGGYQRWLVTLAALTIIFDGVDNQLLGVTIPSIMADWHVARSAFAPVVALGYAGMMIGGAAAGLAGDRFGRRGALLSSMALFGICTLVVSVVSSVDALAALRFAAGIGLGGAMPNAAALAAEYVPARKRALAVTLTIVCVPLGGTLAGLIAIPALPAFGWRALFVTGGIVPIVAALALLRVLPESPRYLAARPARWNELRALLARMGHPLPNDTTFEYRRHLVTARATFGDLFTAAFRRDTLSLWLAFFTCLLAVYLGFSWLPSILSGAGLGATVASTGITVFNLGGVAGAIGGGLLIGRVGSRATMLTITAAAVAGALALSATAITADASVTRIIVLLAFTGGMINAAQTTMFALAAHVYPTAMRATGVGTAVSIGRAGAVLSGYAGPWALGHGGSTSFFRLMAGALCVTLLALAAVQRHVPRGEKRAAPEPNLEP